MTTRAVIVAATAELLARSSDGDVSTRAVCEAARVQQPVIYRLFGDKEGLLAATIDSVWDQYLGLKRAAEQSEDPLDDLRAGWDSHTSFALANPNAYRLLYGSTAVHRASSAAEAMRLLRAVLDRLAAQGRLLIDPEAASRLMMAANTGVALALVLNPALYPDPLLSGLMRDSVIASVVTNSRRAPEPAEAERVAAITLRNALPRSSGTLFTSAEAPLLDEWLERIQTKK
ncbi:TetR/AcrR family transcriptional regulator [Subtercola frigoramans]|uniref:AcrR family transcriptional regulator n=1 Tax=Subtercola frigoramans TaxID=120298 RepID=A0ABS2L1M5_9MICO|nr:TetR/AcrR family transcriptional regulator [Subtercola frigoramans]MBM7470958.1 AcrR family transcriptional regulator [Subtercola frigoramans]